MHRLGRLDDAIESLQAAQRAAPEDPLRAYFLGRAQLLARSADATRTFAACAASAWCRRGAELAARQVPAEPVGPEALAMARAADDGSSPEAALALARLLSEDGRSRTPMVCEGCETPLARAMRLAPDWAEPWVLRGRLRVSRGETREGLADFEAALERDAGHTQARRLLAEGLLATGQPGRAVDHLQRLVDEDGDLAPRLAEALLESGAASRALGWLQGERGRAHPKLLARALVAAGRSAEALRIPEAAGSPELAWALAAAGQKGLAEVHFAAAVATPDAADAPWLAYADWQRSVGDEERAEDLLRRGLREHPQSAAMHMALGELVAARGERFGALRLFRRALSLKSTPDAVDRVAQLELSLDDRAAAIGRWKGLVMADKATAAVRLRLAKALLQDERAAEAAALLAGLAGEGHSLRVQALVKAGEPARAVAELKPTSSPPLRALALAAAGRTEAARAAFEAALKEAPRERPLRIAYADFLRAGGDPEGAVAQLRHLLARDPTDGEALARLIEQVGTSRATLIFAELGPHAARSDETLSRLAKRAEALGGEPSAVVLRDERVLHVEDRITSIVTRRSVLVRSARAVPRFEDVAIPFHAGHPPEVIRARTLDPEGEAHPVDAPVVENPYAGTPLYSDGRLLRLSFPEVEPGSIIDYEVRTPFPQAQLAGAGIWWDAYLLANAVPTVRARYQVDLPVGAALHHHAPGLGSPVETLEAGRRRLIWEAWELPALDPRAGMGGARVHVSSMGDWAEVDAWYHAAYAPKARAGARTQALTRGLLEGLESPRQKVAAIYRHVESEVRYLGLEFGVGAFTPRPAEQTLARGEGDCKDMVALMQAMLEVAGIESAPALIRPRGRGSFPRDHASPGHFSHVILHVPSQNLWLDPTAGLGTLDAVPWLLRGQLAFLVNGRGGRLVPVPQGSPEASELELALEWFLQPTGAGRVEGRMRLSGDVAASARRRLLPLGEARAPLLRAPGYIVSGALRPTNVTLSGLEDPAAQIRLRFQARESELVGLRLDGPLLIPSDRLLPDPDPPPLLGEDTAFTSPRTLIRKLRVYPPKGYTMSWAPLSFRHDAGPLGVRIDERRGEGWVEFETRLSVRPGSRRGPEALAALQKARETLRVSLLLEPGPDFDRVAMLSRLAEESPRSDEARVMLGQALLDASRPNEAASALGRFASAAAPPVDGLALLAAALLQAGRGVEAEPVLRRLLERADHPWRGWLWLGVMLLERGAPQQAAEALAEGLAKHQDQVELGRWLVRSLRAAGDSAQAYEVAVSLARRFAKDVEVQALLGDVAVETARLSAAEQAYQAALSLQPGHPRVLNNLAWALRHHKARLAEAIGYAERAVAADPASDSAWDTLAELHYRNGARAAALEAIEQALRLAPERRGFYEARRQKYLSRP